MKTIVRYLVVSSFLLGAVWLLFGFQVNNRSVYSHIRAIGQEPMPSILQQFRSELELDQAAPARGQGRQKARPKKKSPSKSEKVAQDRRVEKLRTAARKANASRARPKAKTVKKPSQRKTRIDDRILAQDEKALDDLLTARLDRLK